MLDLKNVGIAVGIPFISCLRAQRHAIEVERSPSWIFPLPVWSHSILMSLNGILDPENIGLAVKILLIICLEAEIHAIKFTGRHLGFFHFRFGRIVFSYVPMES